MKKLLIGLILTITLIPMFNINASFYNTTRFEIGTAVTDESTPIEPPSSTIGYGGWSVITTSSPTFGVNSYYSITMGNFPIDVSLLEFNLTNPVYISQNIFTLDPVGLSGTPSGLQLTYIDKDVYQLLIKGSLNPNDIDFSSTEIIEVPFIDLLIQHNFTFQDWTNQRLFSFEEDFTDNKAFGVPIPHNKVLMYLTVRMNIIEGYAKEDLIPKTTTGNRVSPFYSFVKNSSMFITAETITVNFYTGLTLYDTQEVGKNSIFTLPDIPEPPTNKLSFGGWRTTTGELITSNVNVTLKEEWVSQTTGTLNLSARWVTADGDVFVYPHEEVNAPEFLTNLLIKFGLNNVFGRYLIFFIIAIGITIALTYLSANIFIYAVSYVSLTILWLAMGYMPLFAGILITLFIALMIIYLINKGGKDNE